MFPTLRLGKVVVASSLLSARTGAVVVIQHRGMEKVKRITGITEKEVFVIGDNAQASTDSRHFGWLPKENIVGVVIMPRWSRRG